jgi:GNAT superfamily N-acetyltransferase
MINQWNSGANRFNHAGEAVFIARADDDRIVGICGLNIDPYLQNATVGRVRHLYVLPSHRRRGIARELLAAVIEAARPHFRLLRLRTRNPAADAQYRSIGFAASAEDALATHVMQLALKTS